jgi:hypothetical protein
LIPELSQPHHLVIGEGAADAHHVSHLTIARGIAGYQVAYPEPPIGPHGRTGFGDLLAALPTSSDITNVRSIVIAYDNNGDPDAAFRHVQQEIRRAQSGYSIPNAPGMVGPADNDLPPIVALPVPGIGQQGALESLILPALSDQWPEIRRLVNQLIAATPSNNLSVSKRDKAILAMMIASVCGDPTCAVRNMWSKREFRNLLEHTCFDPMAEFFHRLPDRL